MLLVLYLSKFDSSYRTRTCNATVKVWCVANYTKEQQTGSVVGIRTPNGGFGDHYVTDYITKLKLVGNIGFEPIKHEVTDLQSAMTLQLHRLPYNWSPMTDSNRSPIRPKRIALPD